MPFTYTIDTVRDAVVISAEGRVTAYELVYLARRIMHDSLYRPNLRFLCDWSGVTGHEICSLPLRKAAYILRFVTDAHRAFVVDRSADLSAFAIHEEYCKAASITPPRIFFRREEAVAYLNEGFPTEQAIR